MPAKHFWDTNLWVYLFTDGQSDSHRQKKLHIQRMLEDPDTELCISAQVLNETAKVLLDKFSYN